MTLNRLTVFLFINQTVMRTILILLFSLFLWIQYPLNAQIDTLKVDKIPTALESVSDKYALKDGWWADMLGRRFALINFIPYVKDPNYELSEIAGKFGSMKKPLTEVLQSESLTQLLYHWMLPSLHDKWDQMNQHEQTALVLTLRHASTYLQHFSIEKEEAYFQTMKEIQYPIGVFGWSYGQMGESLFTRRTPADFYEGNYQMPHPFHHPYRRVETFIYRRAKEGVSVDLMKTYIAKLLSEFQLPENKQFSEELESGEFKDGKPHGVWQLYEKTSKFGLVCIDSGNYENGLKEGVWMSRGTYDPKDTTWDTYEKGKKVKSEYHSYWRTNLSFIWIVDLKERHRIDKRYSTGRLIKEQVFSFKFNVKPEKKAE